VISASAIRVLGPDAPDTTAAARSALSFLEVPAPDPAARFDWAVAEPLALLAATSGSTPHVVLLSALVAQRARYGDPCPDLTGRPTFRELIGRVARRADDAVPPPGENGVVLRCADADSAVAGLTLTVERFEPTVAGSMGCQGGHLDDTAVDVLLGHLHTLLVAALRTPDEPVADLPLQTRHRLLMSVRENDRIADALQDARPAHELVRAHARRRPDTVAVDVDGVETTYRELDRRTTAVAEALTREHGGAQDAPVLVRTPPGPDHVAALLGLLTAGAHLVCPDQSDIDVTVDGPIVLDSALQARTTGPRVDVSTGLATRAYVARVRGPSGVEKGIPHTHGALAQFATWFARQFGVGPGSRVAQWAPEGSVDALLEICCALVAGATLCPVPERVRSDAHRCVDWLAEQRITLARTNPAFAQTLLTAITGSGAALPDLEHLVLVDDDVPGELANGLRAALPSVRLVTLYGPGESIHATWHEITGPVSGTAPVGRPVPGRHVLVLDDADRPCPRGVTGEIVVRSPYLAQGYLGGSATDRFAFGMLTGADRLVAPGACFRTGDLGRLRWDGTLQVVVRRTARRVPNPTR
jgi:non-ribosomal peptide synthetase component F